MNISQVESFYMAKENHCCPATDTLIKGGYQQKRGGYIKIAKEQNLIIDYTKAQPSQWWHLIHCYCGSIQDKKRTFTKRIQCGELLLWMAEVAQCINKSELDLLVKNVLKEPYNRRRGNKLIKDKCFNKIVEKVESTTINHLM